MIVITTEGPYHIGLYPYATLEDMMWEHCPDIPANYRKMKRLYSFMPFHFKHLGYTALICGQIVESGELAHILPKDYQVTGKDYAQLYCMLTYDDELYLLCVYVIAGHRGILLHKTGEIVYDYVVFLHSSANYYTMLIMPSGLGVIKLGSRLWEYSLEQRYDYRIDHVMLSNYCLVLNNRMIVYMRNVGKGFAIRQDATLIKTGCFRGHLLNLYSDCVLEVHDYSKLAEVEPEPNMEEFIYSVVDSIGNCNDSLLFRYEKRVINYTRDYILIESGELPEPDNIIYNQFGISELTCKNVTTLRNRYYLTNETTHILDISTDCILTGRAIHSEYKSDDDNFMRIVVMEDGSVQCVKFDLGEDDESTTFEVQSADLPPVIIWQNAILKGPNCSTHE